MTATLEATICGTTGCGVPLSNGYTICADHTGDLLTALRQVAGVWANLRVTIARQDATAASIGGGATGSRPCINLDAHDKGETLTYILNGWAAMLNDARPRTTPPAAAGFLADQVDVVSREEWAGDLYAELAESLRDCRMATDRAADKISLGTCGYAECPGTVTAIVGAHTARCKECGVIWDVVERQEWIIAQAWHVEAPLRMIVGWLRTSKHISLGYETLKKRAQRGKLYGRCDLATRETVYTVADIYHSCTPIFPPIEETDAA